MKTQYEIISEARKILELPESATLAQIKGNYKRLAKKWHPDRNGDRAELYEEKIKEIISAYKTVISYCNHYEYSFSEEEVEKYITDRERWFRQFGSDPVWAGFKK